MTQKSLLTLVLFLTLMSTTGAVAAPMVPRPAPEVYANDGGYWTQTSTAWGYTSNSGYCYVSNVCTPKYHQFGYNRNTSATVSGKWDNIDYASTYGRVYAFIPSTNATATANYLITYNGGASTSCLINQNNYFNQWVQCAGTLLGVRNVNLNNYSAYGTPNTLKVAFDEIKLEY